MAPVDVAAVTAVEQAAYGVSHPKRSYTRELQNKLAHYFVLRLSPPNAPPTIIGLAGFWLIADEAHIMTVAIHPGWRGLGLGEWLLLALLQKSGPLGALVATLEVRVSNQIARALYHKYEFQPVGCRPGYYADTGEDALILTTSPLTTMEYQAMLRQRAAALTGRLTATKMPPLPR
jgi:ribosomal-protein-alanine N-acetyltransferase